MVVAEIIQKAMNFELKQLCNDLICNFSELIHFAE